MIRIQEEDFSVGQEVAALTRSCGRIGGVVTFVGTVRDFSASDDVAALILEHYPGMTERELERIEAAARARFQLEALGVVHRVGRLAAGENIVLVVAAAEHRADAFDACRYVIDHLKIRATFWKKEVNGAGEARWVDACPGCEAAASRWEGLQDVPHSHATGAAGQGTGAADGHQGHDHVHGHNHANRQSDWTGLNVGILTLSDSRDRSRDGSGDALEGMALGFGAAVRIREILADDRESIAALLSRWADGREVDVILTTGGTGAGPRDVTPEATRAVCDREMPGFSELIRSEGLKKTRRAVLTRGVCAFRGTTLIVNLPGSTRGAAQSLEAVADLVPHALSMARGGGHP